jgi:Amino acid permease
MALRMGKGGALFLWVCNTQLLWRSCILSSRPLFASQPSLSAKLLFKPAPGQSMLSAVITVRLATPSYRPRTFSLINSRLGFPDKGYFGYVSKWTQTPLRAIWFTTIFSIFPGFLQFASPVAATAIFSLTAMALDISYIIPIALRRIYRHHPEVQFTPGPFYMGDGLLGWAMNINCILWTLFVSVIFSLPTNLPVTKNTMNYASVITGGVVLLAMFAVLPLFRAGASLRPVAS